MARLSLVVTVHNNNCNTVSATNSATGRGLVLNIYGPLGSRVLNTIRQLSSPEHKEKVGGGEGGVACFLVYKRIGLLSINVCAQIKSPFLTPPLCTGHVSYHTIYLMDPLNVDVTCGI